MVLLLLSIIQHFRYKRDFVMQTVKYWMTDSTAATKDALAHQVGHKVDCCCNYTLQQDIFAVNVVVVYLSWLIPMVLAVVQRE